MGCIQIWLRDNPLTKRGLTLAQRIDCFGSIFYFFFGLQRLLCLIAPLASLLFSTPPLKPVMLALTNDFFSVFLASALVMRPVSRGSRNPFWSAYEIAMCFTLSMVALKALATPRKERPFEVTPKGQRVKKSSTTELSLAWPHLVTFGLLIFGLVLGVRHWWQGVGDPGLPVSLFWGKANILLLTVALFVASEQAQGPQGFRLKRDFSGGLFVDGEGVPARIVRQEPKPSGGIEVGLQFNELNEHTRQVLVDKIHGDPVPREDTYRTQPGIGSSLRSLLQALTVPWRPFIWNRRRMIRVTGGTMRLITAPSSVWRGRVEDMSFTGISALFSGSPQDSLVGSLLELPGVTLKVSPVAMITKRRKTLVHVQAVSIESGEERWRSLHNAR